VSDRSTDVRAWVDDRADEMAALLEALVRVPTENPPAVSWGDARVSCAMRWTGWTSRPS